MLRILIALAVAVIGGATVTDATQHRERRQPQLIQCTIDTTGTGWGFAYVRSNPCNNLAPIATLYTGNTVYNLGTGT